MESSAVRMVAVRAASVSASRFGAVQGPVDLRLLRVEPADEGVELVEGVLQLVLPALQRLAELAVDRLQLGQAAAVEDQRHRAEELLDLHVAVGPLERDEGPSRRSPVGSALPGGGQLHVLLPEQRGLLDRGDRVRGQLDVAVDEDGDPRGPVLLVELDLLDPADRHVRDADGGLLDQVEHVEELDLDAVRVVADVGAAGQVERVGAPEAAPAEQQDAGGQGGDPPRGAGHSDAPVIRGRPTGFGREPPPPPIAPMSASRSSS